MFGREPLEEYHILQRCSVSEQQPQERNRLTEKRQEKQYVSLQKSGEQDLRNEPGDPRETGRCGSQEVATQQKQELNFIDLPQKLEGETGLRAQC